MVAPAQVWGRFTGKLGVSARHPRLLPHLARALWHALDDNGGARRRCSSRTRTERWCSRVKEGRIGRLGLAPMRPSNFHLRRDERFATLGWRTSPETNRGRVVKLAAAVYRATWQMAGDQSPWT